MSKQGAYDGALQMFVEPPRGADARTLRFLRWLAERGPLEHAVAGPPVAPAGAIRGDVFTRGGR
jgi:hypothetical protein